MLRGGREYSICVGGECCFSIVHDWGLYEAFPVLASTFMVRLA